MMQWAPVTTSGRRRAVICSVLLAAIVCAWLPNAVQAKSRKIRGPGYSTIVPKSWKVQKTVENGWAALYATSPSTRPGVPPGTMYIEVRAISTTSLTRQLGLRRLPSDPETLLTLVAASPNAAQNINVVAPLRSIDLRGVPAAAGAASYVLGNTSILQSNIVCIRHRRAYLVQLFVDTTLQYSGTRALVSANAHWRWH
jgi:hypothetical protein